VEKVVLNCDGSTQQADGPSVTWPVIVDGNNRRLRFGGGENAVSVNLCPAHGCGLSINHLMRTPLLGKQVAGADLRFAGARVTVGQRSLITGAVHRRHPVRRGCLRGRSRGRRGSQVKSHSSHQLERIF